MEAKQGNMALGFDYSHWQGSINWPALRGKAAFGFGEATNGLTGTDPNFKANYAAQKAVGIARGAYHYAKPGLGDPAGQAQHYVNTVKAAGGFDGLPPMLDIEDHGGLTKAALAWFIRTFANAVKVATGRQVILYTGVWFAQQYLDPALCKEFQLFIADYGVNQPPNVLDWTKWLFFQYTDSGSLPGISGHVDLDVFDGTAADLTNFLGGTSVAEPSKEVDFVRVVTADVLNIRTAPGTGNPVRYQVKKGQELHFSHVQGDWGYTTYGSLGGWVDMSYVTLLPQTPITVPAAPAPSVPVEAPKPATEAPAPSVAPEAPVVPTEGTTGPSLDETVSQIEYHLTAAQTLLQTLKGAK